MADKPNTRVVTGKVRLSYVHLFEAYTSDPEEQEPKYSVTILIPKKDKATLKKIEDAIAAAKEEGKKSKWDGKIPPNFKTTLHDGDEEADLERNPEDRNVITGAALKKLNQGEILRDGQRHDVTIDGPDNSGFKWNPGDFKIPISELKKKYDAETWDQFQSFAKKTALDKNLFHRKIFQMRKFF